MNPCILVFDCSLASYYVVIVQLGEFTFFCLEQNAFELDITS